MRTFYTLLFLCFAACTSRQDQSNTTLEKILTYQDNRTAADSLYAFLKHPDPILASRAVVALGQMQDTMAIDRLIDLAATSPSDISQKCVFALGQIGFGSAGSSAQLRIENALLEFFEKTNDPSIRSTVLESLGKTGSARSFERIRKTLNDSLTVLRKEAAWACARLAIRDIRSDSVGRELIQNLKDPNADVRWACVYALMRIRDKNNAPALLPSLNDEDYRVRMDAARALGLMKTETKDPDYKEIVQALVVSAFNDRDWRVRVNAVNALGNFKFNQDDMKKIYFLIAFEGKKDPVLHVRISAIRSMAKSYENDVKESEAFLRIFTERFLKNAEPQEKAEIFVALSQMFKEKFLSDKAMNEWIEDLMKSPDGYLRARIAEALGYTASPLALTYLEKALKDPFGLVQNNTLEALSKIKDLRAENMIVGSLDTKDPTLLSISSGILSADETLKKDRSKSDMLSQKIIRSFQEIKPPVDVEAQMAVFDALGEFKSQASVAFLRSFLNDSDRVVAKNAAKNMEKITGEKQTLQDASGRMIHPIDFAYYLKLKSGKPAAVIETNKGRIDIEFNIDDAPLTVINFIKLSEKKFFDGLRFHRIVPNFVIQGGDPLGTGWGGPGYSIRSEFSALHYERGTLGMASAGKDTEGCQWFITHAPQPHLDGRYTIFGKVRNGMDVVDAIQVGDTISHVKIVWH